MSTGKVLFIMVGLPARGKSYISKKISCYASWLGLNCRVFNVGNQRRVAVNVNQDSEFFNPNNQQAKNMRETVAMEVLFEALEWLRGNGEIALFDATNSTKDRREKLLKEISSFKQRNSSHFKVVFIESICNDPEVIECNLLQKISNSPDYKNIPPEEALQDLKKRIENYERAYETINEDEKQYIKLINLQSKVIANKIKGSFPQKMVGFLMSIHVGRRPIWLVRSGSTNQPDDFSGFSSVGEVFKTLPQGKDIVFPSVEGTTAALSESGEKFALALADFIAKHPAVPYTESNVPKVRVYTSLVPRAIQTASHIKSARKHQSVSCLSMLDIGVCMGKSLEELKKHYNHLDFQKDCFNCRLPGGESYMDMMHRLEPFVVEMERHKEPVVIVSHISTLQVIYAYFMGVTPLNKWIDISIPIHSVLQLTPSQYGWKEELFQLNA